MRRATNTYDECIHLLSGQDNITRKIPKLYLATYVLHTLREEILAGRKFGGFGGFCPKPPN